MRMRLTNPQFHDLLTTFAAEVSLDKYKKMPYNTYRNLRKVQKGIVDIYYESYTALGKSVERIVVSPDGPVGYEFELNDGSFGSFLYNFLKEETKAVGNEDKKQYDMFGNVLTDEAKVAYNEYLVDKYANCQLTSATKVTSNIADNSSGLVSFEYQPSSVTAIGSISTCSTEIKTGLEVANDRIKKVEEQNEYLAEKVYHETANLESRLHNELSLKVDKIEIDTLEKRVEDLEEQFQEIEKSLISAPPDKIAIQSTSSKCYPAKNFKLNIADCDTDNRKEKENMDTNKIFNFDFGPVASHIRMSPYGLAVRGADNKFVSYDKSSGNIMDVEVFNFDAQQFLFKMPVPVNQVNVGDIVVHMRKPMFVRAVKDGVVSVIDIYNAEAKDILPVKSPFGFNFITKVVSLIDMSAADANNPFGNMLPFLMLGEGQDFKDVLPLMLMTGNNAFGNMAQNPLMLYALMGDNGNMKDILPFMLMSNMFQTPTKEHHYCHDHHENNGECHN